MHGRASSSDFDTLIFQPFRRCPQLSSASGCGEFDGFTEFCKSLFMTIVFALARYDFNALFGDKKRGKKSDGRGNTDARTRRAFAAEGQNASRNCSGCWRGAANRIPMEDAVRGRRN
jgi:hypothetical protein